MPGNAGNIQYSLREPFERAVESVCRELVNRGLRVVGHLDISRRVERSLGIVLPPCKVVFVLPQPALLSPANGHPCVASFLPLHIVISSSGGQSEIQVQNRLHSGDGSEPPGLMAPVIETQAQMRKAIEAIAMRPSLVA